MVERPHVDPVFCPQPAVAQVDEHPPDETREVRDGPQSGQLRRREARLRLDLQREMVPAAAQDQVDLGLARLGRRPVGDLLEQLGPGVVSSQHGEHPTLDERSALLRGDRTEVPLRRAHDPWIHPVELRVPPLAHAQARLEGGHERGKQRVLEDAEIPLDRGPGRGGVARKAGDVDDLPVEQCRDREEPQEGREVPNEGLRAYLLADVQLHVRLEGGARIVGLPDQGDAAEAQDPAEVEVAS